MPVLQVFLVSTRPAAINRITSRPRNDAAFGLASAFINTTPPPTV